jgi:diketogulonate reductase-like aldo/keto reductase
MSIATSALSKLHILNSSPHTTPTFLYGTAWKKEQTADLVYEALKAGFKGVDTAAQPKHYNEKLVGDGIRRAVSEGLVKREDLFVSTSSLAVHSARWSFV